MDVREGPNSTSKTILEREAWANVFPLYVACTKPNAPCLVAKDGGRVVGAVVSGRWSSVPFVPGAWLVAANDEVQSALLRALSSYDSGAELNFPERGAVEFGRVFPTREVGVDRYYSRPWDRALPHRPPPARLRIVSARRFGSLVIDGEMRQVIGDLTTLPQDTFFGLAENDELVATAECTADIGEAATIQQVYTREDRRRRGYATITLTHVCRHLAAQRKLATYLASETNEPSLRLAESVGFELRRRFAWSPLVPT